MKVTLNPFLQRAIESTGAYNVPQLLNALNASYNDETVVTQSKEGINSTRASEKKASFTAREGETRIREGKLNNPLRMINLSKGLDRFHKTYGEPSAELTLAVVPVSLVSWLDDKFAVTAKPATAKRNGDVKSVPAPTVPA